MTDFQMQLSNVGSTIGWGLLTAIPTGIVVGLFNQELYLIVIFPVIMGCIIDKGAQKGIRILIPLYSLLTTNSSDMK